MTGNIYGYIRVSTKEQNTDRQLDALLRYGIKKKHMFIDKQSGKDFARPQYRRLLKNFQTGDCLVITSLDRLGRNYSEIQEEWRLLTKIMGIDIVVMDMPLLNTRQAQNTLLGKFLSDMVLQLLSYVAENERHNIRRRQAEGIASAKARGVQFGRKVKPLPANFHQILQLWRQGKITAKVAAEKMHVSISWLYRKYHALYME